MINPSINDLDPYDQSIDVLRGREGQGLFGINRSQRDHLFDLMQSRIREQASTCIN